MKKQIIQPFAEMIGKQYESTLVPGLIVTVTKVARHQRQRDAFLYMTGEKRFGKSIHVFLSTPEGTEGGTLMATMGYPLSLFNQKFKEVNKEL